MKELIVFIISVIILVFSVKDLPMFSTTRSGERFEYFDTIPSSDMPEVLRNYLKNENIVYHLYKIPNYVEDLLVYNNDFSIVYKSKPKYTIIVFSPEKNLSENYASFKLFYEKLQKLSNEYSSSFNLITKNESDKVRYPMKYERQAYSELRNKCGGFCLINPSNNTIFVFKRITISEKDALDAVFQQYDFMLDK